MRRLIGECTVGRKVLQRRAVAAISAAVLITLVGSAPTFAAVTTVSFHWDATFGGNIDDRCGTEDQTFKVTIFEDNIAEGLGRKARVCSFVDNFQHIPLSSDGTGNWNDRVSAMNVQQLASGGCIRFYYNKKGEGDTPRHDYDALGLQNVQSGGSDQYSRVHAQSC